MLLGLALVVFASPQTSSAAPLVDPGVLDRLRSVTSDVAKTGESALVQRMRTTLLGLGDEADELTRLVEKRERTAASARPTRSTRSAVATRLARELQPLLRALESATGERKAALARWILELDSAQPEANAALGHVLVDGRWMTSEEERWRTGAGRVAERVLAASAMDFHVEHAASQNPAVLALGGGHAVSARGLELHSRLPPETLERILVRLLRAAALSHGLLKNGAPLPRELAARRWVLLDTQAHWRPALDEALAGKGLTADQHAETLRLEFGSMLDARGWRTVRFRPEADLVAAMLYDVVSGWIPHDAQPCLRVGHLHWLCLTALGTSMPLIAWRELDAADAARGARTTARLEDDVMRRARWRATRRSMWGSRSWMLARVREGRDPPWARAMLDDDGKIRDENLLKTMLVCAMLQEEGELAALVEATRGVGKSPVERFEDALGPLPELEARWQRWLDPERGEGVLQRLHGAAAHPGEPAEEVAAGLLVLNQARANALKGQTPEIRVVTLDDDLSRAAELHARYLELNPAQKAQWPEVHEEFPGAPGFTVEGSLAGGRSLISFGLEPDDAVRSWLGTFYHRLPLLEPGLFGVGLGQVGSVVVMDVRSLVLDPWRDHVILWPLPDEIGVPLAFQPEAPNPVPGADMAVLGQPVTVQLYFVEPRERLALELELFRGELEGERVACHVISPDAPLQIELVPENAWGLVPERHLSPSTRYTARARWGGDRRVWSFTTGKR
jgi:hypothetical protein